MLMGKCATTAILVASLVALLMGYDETRAETRARVRIFDELGSGQVRDTVTITIGGVTKTITLNEGTPSAYVEYYCIAPGQYPGSLKTTTYYYQQGKLVPVSGQLEFTLDCHGDVEFEVAMNSTNPVTLTLQRRALAGQERENVPTPPPANTAQCSWEWEWVWKWAWVGSTRARIRSRDRVYVCPQ